jgi:DNA-binding MarR family transcriptional regulator/N-acetylglutamate synthase-like GNAT family acetyltransferase
MPEATETDRRAETVRRFNRFYTRRIGLLRRGYLDSPFSLTEARVLYEIAQGDRPTATDLCRELAVDAGYLSRLLMNLQKRGLIDRKVSESDARQSHLSLTRRGRRVFAPLDARAHEEVAAMLGKLPAEDQKRLIDSIETIGRVLGDKPREKSPYLLRPHQPGDIGWVVHRHGVLYFQEYGWDERFEALVAEIAARFIQNFDAKHERCWIAEKDGAIAGSVFLVRESDEVAKLRLLLVEPWARGLGIGNRLVEECIRFARQVRYPKITLWTQAELAAAQHIYKKAGFRLVREEPHALFGIPMVGQIYELDL